MTTPVAIAIVIIGAPLCAYGLHRLISGIEAGMEHVFPSEPQKESRVRRWRIKKAFDPVSEPAVVGTGPNLAPDEIVEVVSLSEVREALQARLSDPNEGLNEDAIDDVLRIFDEVFFSAGN